MEGFKQTEIGWIPEDWEVIAIGDLCSIFIGKDVVLDVFSDDPNSIYHYPVYSNTVDKQGLYGYYKTPQYSNNSVTVVGRGIGLGRAFARYSKFGAVGRLIVLCQKKYFNPNYLSNYINSQIKIFFETGGIPQLTGVSFSKYLIAIPINDEEQEAIAKALSDVDSLIDTLERKIAKKRNIKQGAMQRLLTGKQRLPGFSGDWVEKKLGEIALMQSGGTPKSDNPHYYNGNIPWLVINDMTVQGKFLKSTEKKISKIGLDNSSARIFKRGTVMYAMYASLGKCSIADIDLSCNQAILGITVSNLLNNYFLYYYLCSIEEDVKNMGQTGTQSNLSKEIVQNFIIKLPSLKEQSAIAQILTDMDNEITTLEQKLDKYKQIKQGMMQQLLTGKIRLL